MIQHSLSTVSISACILLSCPAIADLVDVEFNSSNGPHWIGVVDTVANTLTIQTWTEKPGGTAYWSPKTQVAADQDNLGLQGLPLVWPAVDGNGNPYDVPQSFSGHIGSDFAFISSVPANGISWNNGAYTNENNAAPGWGGNIDVNGNRDVGKNESQFVVPISSFANPAISRGQSIASGSATTAVPEPSAFIAVAAALIMVTGGTWLRRRP